MTRQGAQLSSLGEEQPGGFLEAGFTEASVLLAADLLSWSWVSEKRIEQIAWKAVL